MTIQFNAIPTVYRGVNFRSRLEAKYAAMFDQLGWSWEYEPIDLKGWIPDFVISGSKPIYAEVKPIWNVAEAEQAGKEIVAALGLGRNDEGEALLLGARLPNNVFDVPALGWLWDHWSKAWSPSYVFNLERGGYDICSDVGSYAGRITGVYDGDHHLIGSPDLRSMWVEAGNLVQWRGAP